MNAKQQVLWGALLGCFLGAVFGLAFRGDEPAETAKKYRAAHGRMIRASVYSPTGSWRDSGEICVDIAIGE